MRKVSLSTLLLAGILVLGAFFRFYDPAVLPPGLYPDEAMNGTNALEALRTGNFKIFYPENNGREGLFINIQALSVWLFGNEPWALRVVSAIFGTFTILGIYLVTKEIFAYLVLRIKYYGDEIFARNTNFVIHNTDTIALLAAFFTATSYWHINFSRIGFRAITVPFFAAFGMYWLLKGLRTGKTLSAALAGIFIGLGLHTYIAFRFVPFVLAVPIIWYLWQWRKNNSAKNSDTKIRTYTNDANTNAHCIPCAVALFLFITFVIALPIGWHFLKNPGDFFGRGGQVSVFAAEQPLYEFVKSSLITLQMFFFVGDCNPRHNFNCQPQLHPLAAFFFIIGLIIAITTFLKSQITSAKSQTIPNGRNSNNQTGVGIWNFENRNLFGIWNLNFGILFAWFFFMMLPASLTTEGLPHALRAIGMIPPVMIFTGLGAYGSYAYLQNVLIGYASDPRFAERLQQVSRIQKEIRAAFLLLLIVVAFSAYRNYFALFEKAPATYSAFRVDLLNMARHVDSLPAGTSVYILANFSDTRYGIPIEAEVIQYITDTARQEEQNNRRVWYLLPEELPRIRQSLDARTRIELIPMNAREKGGVKRLLEQFPELKPEVMDDFAVLRNYQR